MYRAQPIFNRLCVDKETERKQEIHRQKINNIQSTFCQKTPQNYSVDYKLNRLKKEQQHESRYTEIERENRILLEKITHIMGKNKIQLNARPGSPKSLNIQTRKHFVSKVQGQNYHFLKRLQDQRSNYSVRQWESDFQRNQQMVSKISQYPFSLFNTPKDGSIIQPYPQHNASIQQQGKTNNQGYINGNMQNTTNNNSYNYSPERNSTLNQNQQLSQQQQQPQRPNTSQVRSSSNKQNPLTTQNFYSQNSTIQQQSISQKQQRSSSPRPFQRNQISPLLDERLSDQPNYNNMLNINNSFFERNSQLQRDRMPVIHSNPSSTKHQKTINGGVGGGKQNRNNSFYSGNLKSLESRDNPSRRHARSKSNSQQQQGQAIKKKRQIGDYQTNKNNSSFSPDRNGFSNQSNGNASSLLFPTNESSIILYKSQKKISGEFFQLEIRQQDQHLIILAEHVENQELKIIEIPQEEAQEFIREECDNDINSLALRLRLHNGKLYLIGTKALQNSNKKTTVSSAIQTSSDNQQHLSNPAQMIISDENSNEVNDNPAPVPSNMNRYDQQQTQQEQMRYNQNDEHILGNNNQKQDRSDLNFTNNAVHQINTVIPNQIHDNHEEQPPNKFKK